MSTSSASSNEVLVAEFRRAVAAIDAAKYGTATEILSQVLMVDPDHIHARVQRAYAQAKLKAKWDIVIEDASCALALLASKDEAEKELLHAKGRAFLARGMAHLHRKDTKHAIADLQQAVVLCGADSESSRLLEKAKEWEHDHKYSRERIHIESKYVPEYEDDEDAMHFDNWNVNVASMIRSATHNSSFYCDFDDDFD